MRAFKAPVSFLLLAFGLALSGLLAGPLPLHATTQGQNDDQGQTDSTVIESYVKSKLVDSGVQFKDQGTCSNDVSIDNTVATRSCPDIEGSQNMIVAEYSNGYRTCFYVDNFSRQTVSYFVPLRTYEELSSFESHVPTDLNVVHGCEGTDVSTGCGATTAHLPDARDGTTYTVEGAGTKKTVWTCHAPDTCGTWERTSSSGSCTDDGACGTAAGAYGTVAPSTDLCLSGTEGSVSWTESDATVLGVTVPGGYWSWTCSGSGGGTDATCTSYMTTINGQCGAAHGAPAHSAPTTGLCANGTATAVSGTGVYTWSCVGHYGGTTVSCASERDTSTCGVALGQTYTYNIFGFWIDLETGRDHLADFAANGVMSIFVTPLPDSSLCTSGTIANRDYQVADGTFVWSCTSGSDKSWCYAFSPISARCGMAQGIAYTSPPEHNLCTSGTASAVAASGDFYLWTCGGTRGGSNDSCRAMHAGEGGVCGAAHGATFSAAPDSSLLCGTGTVSDFAADGYGWSWYCFLRSGFTTEYVSCRANADYYVGSDGSSSGGGGGGDSGCGCAGTPGSDACSDSSSSDSSSSDSSSSDSSDSDSSSSDSSSSDSSSSDGSDGSGGDG